VEPSVGSATRVARVSVCFSDRVGPALAPVNIRHKPEALPTGKTSVFSSLIVIVFFVVAVSAVEIQMVGQAALQSVDGRASFSANDVLLIVRPTARPCLHHGRRFARHTFIPFAIIIC
jgi:hypothetical protein